MIDSPASPSLPRRFPGSWKMMAAIALAATACAVIAGALSSSKATSAEHGQNLLKPVATAAESATEIKTDSDDDEVLSLPREAWPAAGLELGPVTGSMFQDSVRVTGKITFNEDRIAHVFPQVAGRVEAVHVRLGQRVKAGDNLITIESPEIGDAKLALFRDRLLCQFAKHKDAWIQEVSRNTHELVESLRNKPTIENLDTSFRDKKLGRNRDQLIAAYSNLRKSGLDYERQELLSRQGITPGKQVIEAKAAHEADLVTFQTLLETLDHEEHHNAMLSTHARQEAENRVAVDEASLKLLGFREADLQSIDPVKEGQELSRYPLRAPFDGTVISKDVALMERVGLDHQILTIADLSTVWVKADLFEQHLPLLSMLDGETIEVTSAAWPGESIKAKVFHTGEVVDEASRTVGLRALADNADGRLKPGMFVEIKLPGEARAATAIIPVPAIQEHQGQQFVFVHLGDDRFERRDVTLGRRDGDRQEIVQGLKTADTVVVRGGFALKSRMLASSLSGD